MPQGTVDFMTIARRPPSGAGGSASITARTADRSASPEYVDVPRTYVIDAPEGKRYPSYRIVARTGELGAYYGIQGTTWKDPPLLENPSETQKLTGGRTLLLYGDGNRLRLVAVKTPTASYWVSNTLLLSLNNRQMVAIARSLQRIGAR